MPGNFCTAVIEKASIMSAKKEIHQDVWRACNKIRSAVAQTNVSLWGIFTPLDPQKDSLISEPDFCNVVRQVAGLSDAEASQVAAHFRANGGRILYRQFCSLIHGQDAPCRKEKHRHWAEEQHVRELSKCEERRLCMLLRKLAAAVAARRLMFRPYFYDYELVAKNAGTVTLNHFSRVLSFLGLRIASEEFVLLLKKFLRSGYSVNYIAFINAIENIILDLEKHGELEALARSAQYPGHILSAEMPKLPRPELEEVNYPAQATHTALTTQPSDESADQLVRRLQHHVLSEGIRTREAFTDKDPHKTGRVTREQFRCALDMLGVAGTQRLFMSESEIRSLADAYKDSENESYICWETFVNDIDKVFTIHGLEKYPCLRVEVPPKGVRDVPRRGAVKYGTPLPQLCQDALDNIRIQVQELSCQLRPGFGNFDKSRCGHVSPEQFRQALQVAGLDVPGDQQSSLLQYFSDDMGFNYQSFLQVVEPLDNPPLYEKHLEQMKRINAPRQGRKPTPRETNIVEILAKMKSKVVKNRMRVIEFLRHFDQHNHQCISKENFARGLDPLGMQLTPTEVETLAEVYASSKQPGYVEYLRLVEAVEEAVTQGGLEKAPTITPVQHLAINDGDHNFLNFEERQMVIRVLERLAKYTQYNFIAAFKDWDSTNTGTISKEQLLKVFSVLGIGSSFSGQEIDILTKCFGVERGLRLEVDYRALSRVLDILHTANRAHAA